MKMTAIALLLITTICWAQTPVDTVYRFEFAISGSPSINLLRNPSVPGTDSRSSFGYGMFVRTMWHPGRLLAIGVMSGYLVIDREEIPIDPALVLQTSTTKNYSARIRAIPLQAAITMQKNGIEVGMGIGPYLMLSTIEGGNSAPVSASRIELGLTYFGSYYFPLNDRITVGPELRVLYLRYRGILSFMPSCNIRIDAFRY